MSTNAGKGGHGTIRDSGGSGETPTPPPPGTPESARAALAGLAPPPREVQTSLDQAETQRIAYITREWVRARALYGDSAARDFVVKALGNSVLKGRLSVDIALAAAFCIGSRAHWEPNPTASQEKGQRKGKKGG